MKTRRWIAMALILALVVALLLPATVAADELWVRNPGALHIAIPRAVFSGQLTRSLNMPDGLSFQIAADDPACKYMTPKYELWVRDMDTGLIVSIVEPTLTEAANK